MNFIFHYRGNGDNVRIFKPDWYVSSLSDINIGKLKEMGIKGVIVDIDNTLVPHNYPEPHSDNMAFFKNLEKAGIAVCLVSNNSGERVRNFNRTIGLPCIWDAKKPLRSSYKKAMSIMGVEKSETAAVGDQVFIDVLGGRRAGVFTILVKPIREGGEGFFIALKRRLEKFVMKGVEIIADDKRET